MFLTATLLILARPSFAEEKVLTLAPETTKIGFFLEATGHDVEGHLHLQKGQIAFDPVSGTASGEIAIDLKRAETGNEKRDKKMHGEVLETERYPLIVFKPERIEGNVAVSGKSTFDLVGTVSIHGSEHPLTLPTSVTIDGNQVSAETRFPVPYVEWGMDDPSVFVLRVAKQVEVTITATGTLGNGG